jgi:hypothetical protein
MKSKDLAPRLPRGALLVAVAALLLAAAFFARGITTGAAAEPAGEMTVFSVAQKQVYINNADDRERGVGKNPFSESGAVRSPKSTKLPAAGDNILSVSNLYSSADKKGKLGQTTETCDFNFNANASCNLTIRVAGGNLIAEGAIHFNSKDFVLAVVGGTGAYKGAGGELTVSPAGKSAQKLAISLD